MEPRPINPDDVEFVINRAQSLLDALNAELDALVALRGDAGLITEDGTVETGAAAASVATRTVGIVGAEGVGKSTLINAILGEDALPTDPNRPGTVAPIFVNAGDAGVVYQVDRTGINAPIICNSKQEFESYLLQRHNENNEKAVARGHVLTANPRLADGLALVDLPGIMAGMSEQVRRETEAALAKLDGAIVVVFGREFGHALDLVKLLGHARVNLDAVVINLRADNLIESGQSNRVAEGDVADHIEQLKGYLVSELIKIEPALGRAKLFAIHLPSMEDLRLRVGSALNSRCHQREIERFQQWFQSRYGLAGALSRLSAALAGACARAHHLDGVITADLTTIAGIMWGAATIRGAVSDRISMHLARLPLIWNERLAEAAVEPLQTRIWSGLEERTDELKRSLRMLAADAQKAVPTSWFKQTAAIARLLESSLNENVAKQAAAYDAAVLEACESHEAACREIAAQLARMELKLLPVNLGAVVCEATEPQRIWAFPSFTIGSDAFLEKLDLAQTIARLLREIKFAEIYLDHSEEGDLYRNFRTYLEQRRNIHLEALQARLQKLLRLAQGEASEALSTTTAGIARQLDKLQQVRALRQTAAKLLTELDAIRRRSGAERLDPPTAGRET